MAVLQPALTDFVRLCNAHAHQLLYHPASVEDIQRDGDVERRNRTLARLPQYTQLQEGGPCPWNTGDTSVNDACDNRILWALEQNAAHALVTEDQRIHRKARERGLSDRVYFIQSAQNWLKRLHEPAEVTLPNIEEVELHTLTPQLDGDFFETIRNDYAGFNQWFQRIAMAGRRAWVYCDPGQDQVQAICIFAVQIDERITDDGQLLNGPALKLCTFKVGEVVRGRKIGELFLRAAFQFATNHQCEHIFLHANETQQVHLTSLVEDFGFKTVGTYKNDAVFVKDHPVQPPALQLAPFEYARLYYPHYLDDFGVQKFIVPIRPEYHDILFPDWMAPGQALPENHPKRHVGNAIKLAYLSNSGSKRPRPGDLVLFYRSHDQKAITTLGIVERYEGMNEPDEIARVVSRRTVYTNAQIAAMTKDRTKVMLFRLIRHVENPVTLQQLLAPPRIIGGYAQSITKITDESFFRILAAANG